MKNFSKGAFISDLFVYNNNTFNESTLLKQFSYPSLLEVIEFEISYFGENLNKNDISFSFFPKKKRFLNSHNGKIINKKTNKNYGSFFYRIMKKKL